MATEYQFIDDSGITRLDGFLVPDPGSALQSAGVSLSAADILGMDSSPIEIVAAPGAGRMIFPLWACWYGNFVSARYTVPVNEPHFAVGADIWQLDGLDVALALPDGLLSEWAFDKVLFAGNWFGTGDPGAPDLDQPLLLTSGDPITDGDGTVKGTAFYTILTTA